MILEQFRDLSQFNTTEQMIIRYLESDYSKIDEMTINTLATDTFTSPATVNRFCNKVCGKGFKAFKVQLLKEIGRLNTSGAEIDADVPFSIGDSMNGISQKIGNLMRQAIVGTFDGMNFDVLQKCVYLLAKAEKIYIFAKGDSYTRAEVFQNRMIKLNKYVILADRNSEGAYNLRNTTSKDCAMFITYSASHASYDSYISYIKTNKIPTITITANPHTKLAESSDYLIQIPQNESLDEKISNFASQTAFEYVLNILYSGLFRYDYMNNLEEKNNKEKITSNALKTTY